MEKSGIGCAVVLTKNKLVLLGKRSSDAHKAGSLLHGEGTWTLPGGKLLFQESFEDAAYREVLEETGIRIDKKSLRLISIANDVVEDAHFVTVGFLSKEFKGEARVMEPDEITEWQWFQIKSLPQPLFFASREILENYLGKTVYRS
jgi:8-oxo-dGTP diphosphatase